MAKRATAGQRRLPLEYASHARHNASGLLSRAKLPPGTDRTTARRSPRSNKSARPDARHEAYENGRARDGWPARAGSGEPCMLQHSIERNVTCQHVRAIPRAQRKPLFLFSFVGGFLFRLAERMFLASLSKPPPRSTPHTAPVDGLTWVHHAASRLRCQPPSWRPMRLAIPSACSDCDSLSRSIDAARRSWIRSRMSN